MVRFAESEHVHQGVRKSSSYRFGLLVKLFEVQQNELELLVKVS